jgi:type II secretory pathway pseudopilin PulG
MKDMLCKKAAMFGLDARIALAIFAALSVITGASLYKAIKQTTATAILTDLTEISKAYEQYYLDTGAHLPINAGFTYKILQLVNNVDSVTGWKGPYLPYEFMNFESLAHSKYSQVIIRALSTEDWAGTSAKADIYTECSAGKTCALFINMNGIPSTDYAIEIDKQVDGGDGATKGKFRWWSEATPHVTYLYRYEYQIMPITNPFD